MSTPKRDSELILDIVKFLQLQPDIPLDIMSYCISKWSITGKQCNSYIDFMLSHNLIEPTITNNNLFRPTLKGLKITEDELSSLVYNHARETTKIDSYLVSNPLPLDLKHSPTITPNTNTKNKIQKFLWNSGSKILNWIYNHIGHLILALFTAYLVYKFGWNK